MEGCENATNRRPAKKRKKVFVWCCVVLLLFVCMSHHATCRKKAMGCGGCQKCWMFFVNYRHDIISFRGTWQFFENCMMAQPVVQVKGRNAENRTYVGDNAGTESSLGAQTLCCFPNWDTNNNRRRRCSKNQSKQQPTTTLGTATDASADKERDGRQEQEGSSDSEEKAKCEKTGNDAQAPR